MSSSMRGYSSQPSEGPLSQYVRDPERRVAKTPVHNGKELPVEHDGRGVLVLTRKNGEKIEFPELNITVTIELETGYKARLIIQAPREITVLRGELVSRLVG